MIALTDQRSEARKALGRLLAAPVAGTIRKLGIAVVVVTVVILGWALLVPIASGAVAEGRLGVEARRKTVQHLDGGIVKDLNVREGSVVKAGDVLIRLDDYDARLAVTVLQAQADALRAEQAAREAELTGQREIRFPADLLARANEPSVQAAMATQRAAFAARRESAGGVRSGIDQRLTQIGEDAVGAAAQARARSEQLALLEREIKDTESLVERGFATRPRLLALQRAAAAVRGEQAQLQSQVGRARAQGAEARVQRRQVGRETGATAADALRTVQGELVQVTEKLVTARQVLARKEIRAPVAGTVVGLQAATIGGVIRPGEPVMDIVPSRARLVVEAQLPPVHADDVHPGQPAVVRLETGPSRQNPTLHGTVRSVSADALTDAQTGQRYFTAQVEIPADEVRKVPSDQLKPGLPVSVLVRTGERTMAQYLIEPITRAAFGAMRE